MEQELKKVGDDLVQEKVKLQEHFNEVYFFSIVYYFLFYFIFYKLKKVISLKSSLEEMKHNKISICDELNSKNEELTRLRNEASSLHFKHNELQNDLESVMKLF